MKTQTMLILSVVAILFIAGCTTAEAQPQQFDYIPVAGQGCAFDVDSTSENTVYDEVRQTTALNNQFIF